MKLSDQFNMMKRNMKKNKLRVFMTVLATTMGCSFLIVLASVGFGLQDSLMEEATSHQSLTEISIYGKEVDENNTQPVLEQDIAYFKSLDGVNDVMTTDYIPTRVNFALADYQAEVGGSLINFESAESVHMGLEEGRFPTSSNEVIVGYHFQDYLTEGGQGEEALAEDVEDNGSHSGSLLDEEITMTLYDMEDEEAQTEMYTIVGIIEQPANDWEQDNRVYLSVDNKESIFSAIGEPEERLGIYDEVYAHASSIDAIENISSVLKDEGYMVYSIADELSSLNMFFNAFKAGLIFVGTIAVLIASIGIFNTMTMAVTERTHEIGVMKALGANPTHIKQMFLLESTFIGLIGSIFGVIIAYGVSIAANLVIPMILSSVMEGEGFDIVFSYIPIELVIISVLISVGVAVISGFRPAAKATSINVLTALRREG